VNNCRPISVPQENSETVTALIAEYEQVTRERILPDHYVNHRKGAVEAFAHVYRFRGEKQSSRAGDAQPDSLLLAGQA
jgi:hypothetical protein